MFRIVTLLIAVCLIYILPCVSQESDGGKKSLSIATANGARPVSVTAMNISRGPQYPSAVQLSGNVEIRTPVCLPVGPNGSSVCDGEMILRADQAVLHEDTGEIEGSGSVRVTPLRREK